MAHPKKKFIVMCHGDVLSSLCLCSRIIEDMQLKLFIGNLFTPTSS